MAARPIGVTIVAVLAWISGLFSIIGGILLLVAAPAAAGSGGLLVTTAIISILLGIIVILVSLGLFRGSNGARIVVSIVFVLNIINAVVQIFSGSSGFWSAIVSALPAIIGLILLFTARANAFFALSLGGRVATAPSNVEGMADADLHIRDIRPDDAGEVLTLQRASFVSEALLYNTVHMPALTQTFEQVAADLEENLGCVALRGPRMVGAARARRDGDLLLIGRMTVAPDQQGAGVGSQLLAAVEERGRADGATAAELFTGSLSEANLRLYQRQGYVETERVHTDDGIDEVYLRKPLR